jgi:hypothetical protein
MRSWLRRRLVEKSLASLENGGFVPDLSLLERLG